MSEPKSLQRLLAVQALYQISINELSSENSIDSILETAIQQPGLEELKKKPNFNYAKKILNGFLENSQQIDLLIRTGGDKRISNFLLYQIAYAEICFVEKFWPDFEKDDFVSCINNFNKVSRRFGARI